MGSWASGGGVERGYWLGISADDNTWRWQVATGSGYNQVVGPAPTLSAWSHVVGT